jgi:hypothetical protein
LNGHAAKQPDQESGTGNERNPDAQKIALHFMQERIYGFGPAFQRIGQPIVGGLDLSDRSARIGQTAQCGRKFLLGGRHGNAGCLQTFDRVRYAGGEKMLAQAFTQQLCNLLRVKTGFEFAGKPR